MSRRANAIVSLVLGLAAGVALPFLQVSMECRTPQSEACVWGKSLLPVTVSISAVFVGAFVAMALFGILEARRPPEPEPDPDSKE